ncbi:MAG TPA: SGNH/GDSL hydrolase family protein [Mycobacteriales bacterium]|nr:SGNH/GDSL hydrolase family protein [Mycobacteriales bacterium]
MHLRPLTRTASLSALAVVLTSALATAAAPASAAAPVYAALGDSYSSGVGTNNYYSDSGSCKRSSQGYPSLWSASHAAVLTFAACSGAKTADVLNNQLGGLSAATTMVTITIGGNDAGFTTVMQNCVLQSDAGCKSAVDSAVAFARGTLPGRLDNVYTAIRGRAPNATVVVLGYPHFYRIGGTCVVGISDTKRGYINYGADVLASVTATEVAKFGGFRYVDTRGVYTGHEICASGEWWLHSVDWFHLSESYHPTVNGYRYGYLAALNASIG